METKNMFNIFLFGSELISMNDIMVGILWRQFEPALKMLKQLIGIFFVHFTLNHEDFMKLLVIENGSHIIISINIKHSKLREWDTLSLTLCCFTKPNFQEVRKSCH